MVQIRRRIVTTIDSYAMTFQRYYVVKICIHIVLVVCRHRHSVSRVFLLLWRNTVVSWGLIALQLDESERHSLARRRQLPYGVFFILFNAIFSIFLDRLVLSFQGCEFLTRPASTPREYLATGWHCSRMRFDLSSNGSFGF